MNGLIEFPQPMLEALQPLAEYWYVDSSNDACKTRWVGAYAADRLKNGNCYSTKAEAEQRAAWNAQEMARLVMPAWFRALGPDVEQRIGNGWAKFNASELTNWAEAKPENFRAKPKPKPPADVVVMVNGKEYRWPATAKEGEPMGWRFAVDGGVIIHRESALWHGRYAHHTRAGAEQQLAAIIAAAGESL